MQRVRQLLARILPRRHGGAIDERQSRRATLVQRNLMAIQSALGHAIQHEEYFIQALLHRSYLQHTQTSARSNERLEFLGDSILNLIVAEYLYAAFPEAEEGELTKMRSRLVNRKALAAYARAIDLPRYILMSPSAAQSVGKGYDTISADTFEALIAALYLDGGYAAARRFVEHQVLSAVKKGSVTTSDQNFKSMLLEYAQSRSHGVPRYAIVKEEGPDHDRTFTVEVLLSSVRRGVGTGKNKKEAEQAAAREALARLG